MNGATQASEPRAWTGCCPQTAFLAAAVMERAAGEYDREVGRFI